MHLHQVLNLESYSPDQLDRLVELLEASGKFRVLRKLELPSIWPDPGGEETRIAIVVDVETTGLDQSQDAIIQFSGLRFRYGTKTGRILSAEPPVTAYNDPGMPIPPLVTRLTGITDEMVAGARLDQDKLRRLVEPAGLIIAHNAAFDRPFLDTHLSAVFKNKHWACSLNEVPWERYGYSSRSLEFLLYRHHGVFFHAHSAEADCIAVLYALSVPFEDGRLPMAALLESARKRTLRIWALRAPIEFKDQLKERGYRWNSGQDGRAKAWFKDFLEGPSADAELQWLSERIYSGGSGWTIEAIDARRRYTRNG